MGAKRVSPKEVEEFNRLYLELGTFAAVARKTGRSASTISRYVSGTTAKAVRNLQKEKKRKK